MQIIRDWNKKLVYQTNATEILHELIEEYLLESEHHSIDLKEMTVSELIKDFFNYFKDYFINMPNNLEFAEEFEQ